MHYKTIALELIQQQPEMHEQLRQNRMLLAMVEHYATLLKDCHQSLKEQLRAKRPQSDESQLSSEAMEIAVKILEDALLTMKDIEPIPLDAIISMVKRYTPPA